MKRSWSGTIRVGVTISGLVIGLVGLDVSCRAAEPEHLGFEVNADVNSFRQTSVDSSLTFAPFGGLYESGWRLRLTVARSTYRLGSDSELGLGGSGEDREFTPLLGYSFDLGRVSILLGTGPDYLRSISRSGAASSDQVVARRGAQVYGFLYATPTDATMASLQVRYSTAGQSFYLQGKVGVSLKKGIYLGPEFTNSQGPTYSQTRLGAFVAGIPLGRVKLSVSAGILQDRNSGMGRYAGISLLTSM